MNEEKKDESSDMNLYDYFLVTSLALSFSALLLAVAWKVVSTIS
jgi:hypothetical protein